MGQQEIGSLDDEIVYAEVAWGRLISVIARVPIDLVDEPGICGDWSLTTLVGHISFWDAFELEHIGNRAELGQVDWQSINEAHDAAYRDRMFADVLDEMKSTHAALLTHVAGLRDLDPTFVRELTHDHYVEHAAEIEQWISHLS
jgi:hypothetical protein